METYISLLSFVVRSLRLDGALVIEIKHDHSPIVIVVLYQSTINYTRFVYIYNRSIAFKKKIGLKFYVRLYLRVLFFKCMVY